ncbi:unnamed protein product [Alopecurus aequalis]
MLARAGTAKKAASKLEDSDSSHTSRPRTMSDPPRRPATRVPPARLRTAAVAAVGSEASGARRALGAGRGTAPAPRSPLHEKKPAGAGSRVAELEAKLGKAHDQLTEMREQLAAAEKARKDARATFDEAKKRFAKQRDVAASAPVKDNDNDHAPAEQKQHAEDVTDGHVKNGGEDDTINMSSPANGVLEPILSESEYKRGQVDEQVKKTNDDGDDVNSNVAIVVDGEGKRGNPEADELRSKLAAKDRVVYEVRAKLMVRDMEVGALKEELTAKDTDVRELTVKLAAKDVEINALRVDKTALGKTASEAAEAAREGTARAREAEHSLRESAVRETRLAERLAASERAREALEAEARRSRVQIEQWRKVAEEAAAVLVGAGHHVGAPDDKDMRRHGSVGGKIDTQDADGEGSGGKRNSGGAVRLLAELWKKKAPK